MCLYSKTNVPKVAEEDIICYKVLITTPFKHLYETPYTHITVDLNKKSNEKFVASGVQRVHKVVYPDTYSISEGFIHTLKTLEETKEVCFKLKTVSSHKRPVIFLCKIPKGVKFFEGRDTCLMSGFASEQIVFLEKLAEN